MTAGSCLASPAGQGRSTQPAYGSSPAGQAPGPRIHPTSSPCPYSRTGSVPSNPLQRLVFGQGPVNSVGTRGGGEVGRGPGACPARLTSRWDDSRQLSGLPSRTGAFHTTRLWIIPSRTGTRPPQPPNLIPLSLQQDGERPPQLASEADLLPPSSNMKGKNEQ
jgi:hypothetical protein